MSRDRKVILSHSGKQHSYHVARALDSLGVLDKFFTSSYITPLWLQNIITQSGNKYWSKRFLPGLGAPQVESHWRFEIKEILYSRIFGNSQKTLDAVYQRDVLFDKLIAHKLQKCAGDVFWGFQGSCFESLNAARRSGKKTICELATGHAPAAVEILGEEEKLHQEWSDSFDNLKFPPNYFKRLEAEPHRADIVIGASSFTLQTLRASGIPQERLRYLPLGFDAERIPFSPPSEQRKSGPLKLLYAGRITQRKGVVYLLEAMKEFSRTDVELHMIGHIHGSGSGLTRYNEFFVKHEPVSQYELFKLYQNYDAFVLPTVFEGFGLVILEAMAAGLPVITTPHSIGPELIRDGENGFIVPIRNVNAITAAVRSLLSKTTEELIQMRYAARETAMQYSWEAYSSRLQMLINSI